MELGPRIVAGLVDVMGVVVTFTIPSAVSFDERDRLIRRVLEAINFATERGVDDLNVTTLPNLTESNQVNGVR